MAEELAAVLKSRIRQARHAMPPIEGKRVSQTALADLLGVHWTTVASWERGANEPSASNLAALARVTGKPVEFFFRSDGPGASTARPRTARTAEQRNGRRAAGRVPGARGVTKG